MEIELGWREWKNGWLIGLGCLLGLLLLVALYLVGKSVTPVVGGHPDWLTPEEVATPTTRLTTPTAPLSNSPNATLLARIDSNELPSGYIPQNHQEYVDRRMAELSGPQRHRISQLCQEKQRLDPDMRNRGQSFVRIMEYVAKKQR